MTSSLRYWCSSRQPRQRQTFADAPLRRGQDYLVLWPPIRLSNSPSSRYNSHANTHHTLSAVSPTDIILQNAETGGRVIFGRSCPALRVSGVYTRDAYHNTLELFLNPQQNEHARQNGTQVIEISHNTHISAKHATRTYTITITSAPSMAFIMFHANVSIVGSRQTE